MKKNIAIFLSFIFLACQSAKADMAIGITGAMHMLDASVQKQLELAVKRTLEVILKT